MWIYVWLMVWSGCRWGRDVGVTGDVGRRSRVVKRCVKVGPQKALVCWERRQKVTADVELVGLDCLHDYLFQALHGLRRLRSLVFPTLRCQMGTTSSLFTQWYRSFLHRDMFADSAHATLLARGSKLALRTTDGKAITTFPHAQKPATGHKFHSLAAPFSPPRRKHGSLL